MSQLQRQRKTSPRPSAVGYSSSGCAAVLLCLLMLTSFTLSTSQPLMKLIQASLAFCRHNQQQQAGQPAVVGQHIKLFGTCCVPAEQRLAHWRNYKTMSAAHAI
jgi:hypothetical protein